MNRLKPETREALDTAIAQAKTVLENGGVVMYPTDTLYGIGVDASNTEAIAKVFELKGRETDKPLSVVVSDMIAAEDYVMVNDIARVTASKVLPGAVTLILPMKDVLPKELVGGRDELAIRIPDSYFCLRLAQEFGRPYTTTSANRAGEDVMQNVDAILKQLNEKQDLIDLVVDVGELPKREASTILRITEKSVEVVREGNVNMDAWSMVTKAHE